MRICISCLDAQTRGPRPAAPAAATSRHREEDRMVAKKLRWLAAATLALAFVGGAAQAQDKFPDHPINFIVPWGPGGGADLLARTSGKIMAQDLGVSFPVLNVPGATGQTGITKLLNAPADGYSLAVLIGDTYALLAGPHPGFTSDQVIPLAIIIQQPSGYWVKTQTP